MDAGGHTDLPFQESQFTTMLMLLTISLDSRMSLPKVHYTIGLNWFLVCSFSYCITTLFEFAAVHYLKLTPQYTLVKVQMTRTLLIAKFSRGKTA